MTKRVGFIGLGDIGWPMAAHVAKAYDCTVWNRTLEKAEAFAAENNAIAAGSPAGVVAASEVVITCLPTSKEVLDVVVQSVSGASVAAHNLTDIGPATVSGSVSTALE